VSEPVSATVERTAYRVKSVEGGRSIEVRLTHEGPKRVTSWDIPAMVRSQCGGAQHVADEALVVGDGGAVDGAVVWIDDIHQGAPLPEQAAVVQDERRCAFTPHVLAVGVRGTLTLKNSDPANHAVRFDFADAADEGFTKTLPAGATYGIEVKPDWAGHYARVTCPIHLWMWSWVHFFEHPYFAVTYGGVARLENVPPGRYHVTVWHEGLGTAYASSLKFAPPETARSEVTVEREDAKLSFTMGQDGKMSPR
jgi:hypothetical protein